MSYPSEAVEDLKQINLLGEIAVERTRNVHTSINLHSPEEVAQLLLERMGDEEGELDLVRIGRHTGQLFRTALPFSFMCVLCALLCVLHVALHWPLAGDDMVAAAGRAPWQWRPSKNRPRNANVWRRT